MSTEQGTPATPPANGSGAPAAPGAAPPATPPKDSAPAVETISMPSEAFKERLAKEAAAAQRKFLKDLGYEKAEDLQTVLATAKSLQDEKKSAQERLEGRIKELEPKAAKAEVLAKRFEAVVNADFEKLDDRVRSAIDKVADGDPEKRFEQMEVLRAAGLIGASAAPPAAAPPVATPPAAPANRAPAGGPPPPPTGGASKFAEWDALRARNPTQASVFYQFHGAAIEASRPADQ